MRPSVLGPIGLLSVLALTGCASPSPGPGASASSSAPTSSAPTSAAHPSSTPASSTPASSAPAPLPGTPSTVAVPTPGAPGDAVEGAVVRFSTPDASVDVTLGPVTPTTVDLVSLMPFTMRLEEFAGREKIGDPPRALDVEGTPGSDPVDGDLIYFRPWGNLGFYYDASGIGYSDDTPHLGTYEATEEQLSRLEGQEVTVELVDP